MPSKTDLKLDSDLVSVDWLYQNLDAEHLVILNATIPKVVGDIASKVNIQIPKTRFFDIKKKFSDSEAKFPNTFPSSEQFSREAGALGISNNSIIVVYDEVGMYSSARAWWLFKSFGHDNVAVLNGGLPEWLKKKYPAEQNKTGVIEPSNFTANYKAETMVFFDTIDDISKDSNYKILDARSEGRFKELVPEPRKGLRSGTIPNSVNLPFTALLEDNKLKTEADLQRIFDTLVTRDKTLVMSCGSGITACVLALGANTIGYKNCAVYDGSWTEYGSLTNKKTI